MKRHIGLGAALAVAAALTFGSPAAAQDKTIRIGAPLALSGGLADEGKKQAAAYELWLERINAAGGMAVGGKKMKVELLTYDYQTDGKRAQQLAEKLITVDKVDFMTAPFGSGHTKIVAGVAERYGVPIIAVASSEPVHDQGFKNLFGTLAPSIGLIEAMFDQFKTVKPDMKTVAVIGRDDVFPKLMATSLADYAPKHGLTVVHQSFYPVGTLDHSSTISSIKPLKPDWVFVSGYTQDLVLFRKQMADLGVTVPIITMITGPAYKEFMDNLGPLAENVTSATWWHHSTSYKGDDVFGTTKEFYDAVVKKTGQEPDYVHASSAAALTVLQKAIERAGTTDRDKVRAELVKTDLQTFYGPIRFRADGMNAARNLPIIQVQGGKPVVLSPPDVKQAAMRLN
ncbi:MAG TPA: amino acid ABC transporter substrate-binding protein [Azospirillum sp.]|nr:amino acid ABC transporter substrate-binding protein [Azospirillum sp.]